MSQEPTAPEGNANAEASAPEANAPKENASTDPATGINGEPDQGDMFKETPKEAPKEEQPKETPKEEPKKEEPKPEEKSAEKSEKKPNEKSEEKTGEEAPKTMEDMGFGNVREDQTATAELATELGVNMETLAGAIKDGTLDVSKLSDDISARDKAILKTAIDAEIIKANDVKAKNRVELQNHVGGKENYDAMTKWVNAEMASNPELRKEVTELQLMMKQGGQSAKLATKSLFEKFKADPDSSLPLSNSENTDNKNSEEANLTKRQKLDKGWSAFSSKHNKY